MQVLHTHLWPLFLILLLLTFHGGHNLTFHGGHVIVHNVILFEMFKPMISSIFGYRVHI